MIWLIVALAFILRLININQSLWLDEATQVILSERSLNAILFNNSADFHPPLSYIIMHFWLLFGRSEVWLRLLSVLFGVGTVAVIYLLSKRIFNKEVGLLSAFLLAVAPYHIYYSQEVRMYAEAAFFATVSIYLFNQILNKRTFKKLIGYIIFTTLLIYTHYSGFFLIFAQAVYLLILRRDQLKNFAKILFCVFLFWFPSLPQFLMHLKSGVNIDQYLPGWRDILSISNYKAIPLTFLKFALGRISFDNKSIYIVVGIIVLTLTSIILFKGIKKLNRNESKFLVYWLFIPILSSYLISFKIPINQPFRMLFVIPAFYILIAAGIQSFGKLKKFFLVLWIGVSLFGLSLYNLDPKFLREDWRGASQFVSEKLASNSIVLFAWPEPISPYIWYGQAKQATGVVKNFPARIEELRETLKEINNADSIYLFEYLQSLSDPNKYIQKQLIDSGFRLMRVYDFRGVGFIDYYTR